MKRLISLSLIVFVTSILSGQYKVVPNKPYSTFNSNPGFVTINEFTGGIGLAGKTAPFSQYNFGFTSVNGYQVNRNFFIGAGVGASVYESGLLVPLFIDFRFAFNIGTITPYIFADGGLLLDVSNLNSTKLFINPGVGGRYTLSRNIALTLGAGFLSQVDGTVRETFVNMKLGVVYVF